ncbi:MAG: hypothetical protein NC833_01790 [Candidatus Omnitrophica bacterium]|nr:hypothetical protein [Candidatus Omnitrophota bacterium]
MLYKNIEFWNVEEIFEKDDGLGLSRIPEDVRNKLNENAKICALMPAGCELRFNLKSEKCKIVIKANKGKILNRGICELYFGDFFNSWYFINEEPTEIEIKYPENIKKLERLHKDSKNLKFVPNLIRVILPHLTDLRILEIKGDFEPPYENQKPKLKLLAYGSSITHGAFSIRPTGSYAFKTAQILGFDLINLGFGGGAHLEKEIVDYIVKRDDWDFGIFELGINMVFWCEIEEFKKKVDYFVETISYEKKDKFLFFIDIYPFFMDFEKEKKQIEFRKILEKKVREIGKRNVFHISGFDILKNLKGLSYDLIHPSPFGMEEISYNLSSIIKRYIWSK